MKLTYPASPPSTYKMNEPLYVLLIDDDEDDIEMFSLALEKKGIRVKSFESSAKALFYLVLMSGNMELPSLIILDYNMPKTDGLQVLLLIKENGDTKDIPVVVYSTGMSDVLRSQLLDAGAMDCFNKPWTNLELNLQAGLFKELAFSFSLNKNIA